MRYDAIVVGAGPAGSTTARECASRGLSVLMLDKAEFPRDKPCGGGVTIRAAELLPFDVMPVVERVVSSVYFTAGRSNGFIRRTTRELSYLTQRRRLDAFLVEQALEAGVVLRQRAPIQEVETHHSHVVVRTADKTFEARTLVAADGANGQTARMAGVDVALVHGIALEGNVTPPDGFPQEWEDMMGLNLGGIPGGYGWIFPKRDHLNIGLGGWKHVGPSLRARLDELVRLYGFDPGDIWGLRGHHLPLRSSTTPLVSGNLLLVGDAAGLVDPLTGEGIHAAIRSGRAAAHHMAEYVGGHASNLDGYQRELEIDLIADLRVSRQLHDLFHLSPWLYLSAERWTSILWEFMCRIFRGEQTYAEVMLKHPTMATLVELASDLVRVTPFLQGIAGLKDPAPPQRFFLGGAQHN